MWLKTIRQRAGISQNNIARRCNLSQQHYSFIESGHRKPSVSTAKRIAEVLNFDWTTFFNDINTIPENMEEQNTTCVRGWSKS